MQDDYCGLTEREANGALWRWLQHADSTVPRAHRGDFTQSRDLCSQIEQRLTPAQFEAYFSVFWNAQGHSIRAARSLIMLDAPTRVRALLAVLGLGKS